MPDFGGDFIREWEQKHYKCDKDYEDEAEYQKIVELTKDDVAKLNIISEKTLKWKDKRERVDRKVNWGKYDSVYAPRFQLIISNKVHEHHFLLLLIWPDDKLQKYLPVAAGILENIHGKAEGFGPPVASTVLHFIFPDRFPIIDIRTAKVMYFADRIKSTNRNGYRLYDPFHSSVIQISENTGYSIHKIDRAIFAFHRDALQPKMNQGRGLPLDAPWKFRQMWIDRIRAEAKNRQK